MQSIPNDIFLVVFIYLFFAHFLRFFCFWFTAVDNQKKVLAAIFQMLACRREYMRV